MIYLILTLLCLHDGYQNSHIYAKGKYSPNVVIAMKSIERTEAEWLVHALISSVCIGG